MRPRAPKNVVRDYHPSLLDKLEAARKRCVDDDGNVQPNRLQVRCPCGGFALKRCRGDLSYSAGIVSATRETAAVE